MAKVSSISSFVLELYYLLTFSTSSSSSEQSVLSFDWFLLRLHRHHHHHGSLSCSYYIVDPLLGPHWHRTSSHPSQRAKQKLDAVRLDHDCCFLLVVLVVLLHAPNEPPHWASFTQHHTHCPEEAVMMRRISLS